MTKGYVVRFGLMSTYIQTELNKVDLSEVQLVLVGNRCYTQRCVQCWFWNGVEIRLGIRGDREGLGVVTSRQEIPDVKGFLHHSSLIPSQSRQEPCCRQAFPGRSFHQIYLVCACSVLSLPGYLHPTSNGEAGNEALGHRSWS